jgi:hypothetical protein
MSKSWDKTCKTFLQSHLGPDQGHHALGQGITSPPLGLSADGRVNRRKSVKGRVGLKDEVVKFKSARFK